MNKMYLIVFVAILFVYCAEAQLKVNTYVTNDTGQPISDVTFTINGAYSSTTDRNGFIKFNLDTPYYESGTGLYIEVIDTSLIINHPVDGVWNAPNIKSQHTQKLRVILLPKGSPKLLSHDRLKTMLNSLFKNEINSYDSNVHRNQPFDRIELLKYSRYLEIPIDTIIDAMKRWVELNIDSENTWDRALAEYFNKEYDQASKYVKSSINMDMIIVNPIMENTIDKLLLFSNSELKRGRFHVSDSLLDRTIQYIDAHRPYDSSKIAYYYFTKSKLNRVWSKEFSNPFRSNRLNRAMTYLDSGLVYTMNRPDLTFEYYFSYISILQILYQEGHIDKHAEIVNSIRSYIDQAKIVKPPSSYYKLRLNAINADYHFLLAKSGYGTDFNIDEAIRIYENVIPKYIKYKDTLSYVNLSINYCIVLHLKANNKSNSLNRDYILNKSLYFGHELLKYIKDSELSDYASSVQNNMSATYNELAETNRNSLNLRLAYIDSGLLMAERSLRYRSIHGSDIEKSMVYGNMVNLYVNKGRAIVDSLKSYQAFKVALDITDKKLLPFYKDQIHSPYLISALLDLAVVYMESDFRFYLDDFHFNTFDTGENRYLDLMKSLDSLVSIDEHPYLWFNIQISKANYYGLLSILCNCNNADEFYRRALKYYDRGLSLTKSLGLDFEFQAIYRNRYLLYCYFDNIIKANEESSNNRNIGFIGCTPQLVENHVRSIYGY